MDSTPTASHAARGMKILGHRRLSTGGLASAAAFLDLVLRLRGGKPFIPKGLHRFKTFEESEEWSMTMMARPPKPGRRSSRT